MLNRFTVSGPVEINGLNEFYKSYIDYNCIGYKKKLLDLSEVKCYVSNELPKYDLDITNYLDMEGYKNLTKDIIDIHSEPITVLLSKMECVYADIPTKVLTEEDYFSCLQLQTLSIYYRGILFKEVVPKDKTIFWYESIEPDKYLLSSRYKVINVEANDLIKMCSNRNLFKNKFYYVENVNKVVGYIYNPTSE